MGLEVIVVSFDGRRVVFIGFFEFIVCVVDVKFLSEVSWIFLFKFKYIEKFLVVYLKFFKICILVSSFYVMFDFFIY